MTKKNDDLVQYVAPDFGVIPSELICDREISKKARLLGCLLWTYRAKDTGEAYPSQKTLGDRLGASERTVSRWTKELRDRGWLSSARRVTVDKNFKGRPTALIYTLYWDRQSVAKGVPVSSVRYNQSGLSGSTGQSASTEHTRGTDQKNKEEKLRINDGEETPSPSVIWSIWTSDFRKSKKYPAEKAQRILEDRGITERDVSIWVRDHWPSDGPSNAGRPWPSQAVDHMPAGWEGAEYWEPPGDSDDPFMRQFDHVE